MESTIFYPNKGYELEKDIDPINNNSLKVIFLKLIAP